MSGLEPIVGATAAAVAKSAVASAKSRADKDAAAVREAAKGTPEMEHAGRLYGQRQVVKQAVLLRLLEPLARFGILAQDYFADGFVADLSVKLAEVPEGQLQTPKGSIAGPAMEGLAYALDEPELKEMYLNLLAGAFNSQKASEVHPSFVYILQQLSAEEVPALDILLQREELGAAQIRREAAGGTNDDTFELTILSAYRRITVCLESPEPDGPLTSDRIPAWLTNWVRLGLAEVSFTSSRVFLPDDIPSHDPGATPYDWVPESAAYRKAVEVLEADDSARGWRIAHQDGGVYATPLGLQFHDVVTKPD